MENIQKVVKHILSDYLVTLKCVPKEPAICKQLAEDGCAVFNQYVDKKRCLELVECARKIINEYPGLVAKESNGSDTRIYGIDLVSNEFNLHNEIPIVDSWAQGFYRSKSLKSFQMLGNIKASNDNLGSGGGWHRDSPYSHQFKFILYLNDVHDNNGPFQYFAGTHKLRNLMLYCKKCGFDLGKYRFSELEIGQIKNALPLNEIKTIVGPAGTLLIADVKGLHRGKPLVSGERWATTRYYYKKSIPSGFTNLLSNHKLAPSSEFQETEN